MRNKIISFFATVSAYFMLHEKSHTNIWHVYKFRDQKIPAIIEINVINIRDTNVTITCILCIK